MRVVRAFAISLVVALFLAPAAFAQWPTTCVELNDIVEAHLGNHQNVGIYQKVFGDQAEQACQNDHRDDVRSVFAWALPEVPQAPTTAPTAIPTPAPAPTPVGTSWEFYSRQEIVSGHMRHFAAHRNSSGEPVDIVVRCNAVTQVLDVYFSYPNEYLLAYDDALPVQWRWNDDPQAQSDIWPTSVSSEALFVPDHRAGEIAYGLAYANRLAFRVTEDSESQHTSVFYFTGGGTPDHPVRKVFQACGRSL